MDARLRLPNVSNRGHDAHALPAPANLPDRYGRADRAVGHLTQARGVASPRYRTAGYRFAAPDLAYRCGLGFLLLAV